jgi:hypothetical protein
LSTITYSATVICMSEKKCGRAECENPFEAMRARKFCDEHAFKKGVKKPRQPKEEEPAQDADAPTVALTLTEEQVGSPVVHVADRGEGVGDRHSADGDPRGTPVTIRPQKGDARRTAALKGARTRAANVAARKRWSEIDKPAREMVVALINERLEANIVRLRWAGLYGRKLKGGIQYGTLLRVLGTGLTWRVLADGYKHPVEWHPNFWELVSPRKV